MYTFDTIQGVPINFLSVYKTQQHLMVHIDYCVLSNALDFGEIEWACEMKKHNSGQKFPKILNVFKQFPNYLLGQYFNLDHFK